MIYLDRCRLYHNIIQKTQLGNGEGTNRHLGWCCIVLFKDRWQAIGRSSSTGEKDCDEGSYQASLQRQTTFLQAMQRIYHPWKEFKN